MEIECDNGDSFHLKPDAPISIGRTHAKDDRTVSRRHISLELHSSNHESDEPRVLLEAVGKNPVWVRSGGEIKVYRKGERAELGSGDAFSISGKKHVWFRLKSEDEVFGDVSDLEFEGVDVFQIDPVKEFGFVIMGHEFDSYSKQLMRDIKKWNWFLEEPKKESDDDDDAAGQKSKGRIRKWKKVKRDGHGDDDDDEWEGESEEDKELISNAKKVPKPTYSTRSKGGNLTKLGTKGKGKSKESRNASNEEEMGDGGYDNEGDETLGDFIVDNEEEMEDDEIGGADEEEEEEEFEDNDGDLD